MELKHCTLTGVDEKTDFSKLWKLSKLHPFVEWGILYKDNSDGNKRYPLYTTIEEFGSFAKRFGMKASIHFCYDSAYDLLDSPAKLMRLFALYPRIQLNYNYTERPVDLYKLDKFMNQFHAKEIITPHNEGNRIITNTILANNHEVIFDTSAGTGKLMREIPEYIPRKKMCGWAGGLGSGNLESHILRFQRAANGRPYWIDMESGIRNENNWLDIDECETVLEMTAFALKMG